MPNTTPIPPGLDSRAVEDPFSTGVAPAPSAYATLTPLPLLQHWRGGRPTHPGHAYIAHCREGVRFFTWFRESPPFTTATRDNQRLYELGSVAEFFVHPPDARAYREFHAAPNRCRMDLRIPDRDRLRTGQIEWEVLVGHPSHARMQVDGGPDAWTAEVILPWKAFGRTGIPRGESWGVAVCRYAYPGRLESPELSSTAPLTRCDFHRLEEFHRLRFPDAD